MSFESEHRALRERVGLTAQPEVTLRRVPSDDWDQADRAIATSLAIRDGQLRQALIAGERDRVIADLYVGNDDGDLLCYGEGLPELGERLPFGCLAINGPFAWELLGRIEGQDVSGFPYLSFYRSKNGWMIFRAGKTGEFGYDLFVPLEQLDAARTRILDAGAAFAIEEVSAPALRLAGLENGFFCLAREGSFGLTPFELQLSWRLSFKKRDWLPGRRRIVYFTSERAPAIGDPILLEDERIGEVLVVDRSPLLERSVGIALIDVAWAYSGLDLLAGSIGIRTASAPLTHNLSTFLKPGRDSFSKRDAIAFPGWRKR